MGNTVKTNVNYNLTDLLVNNVNSNKNYNSKGSTGGTIVTVKNYNPTEELELFDPATFAKADARSKAAIVDEEEYLLDLKDIIDQKLQTTTDETEKATLEALKQQVEYRLLLVPYFDILNSEDFKNYSKKYDYNTDTIDYERLASTTFNYSIPGFREITLEEAYEKGGQAAFDELAEHPLDILSIIEYRVKNAPEGTDPFDLIFHTYDYIEAQPHLWDLTTSYIEPFKYYVALTDEEKMLYHYIHATQGYKKAEEFIATLQPKIDAANDAYMNERNMRVGLEKANAFIAILQTNDEGQIVDSLGNIFSIADRGVTDGINNFVAGIENLFYDRNYPSADEYARLFVLDYLNKNSSVMNVLTGNPIYTDLYNAAASVGNMAPSIMASMLVSIIASPAAGAAVGASTLVASSSTVSLANLIGPALVMLSATGNAKHQALVGGHGAFESALYGLFIGLSESTLEYFLGGIPGLSKDTGMFLKSVLSEGGEEFIQEWLEAGARKFILGEDVDWSEVPGQAMDSFMMGMMIAAFLNAPKVGSEIIVNLKTSEGINCVVNVLDVIKTMKNDPSLSITDAINKVNGIEINSKAARPAYFSDIETIDETNLTLKRNQIYMLAQYYNVSEAEMYSALNETLSNLLENSDYGIRISNENLMKTLQGGYFKTLFETGGAGDGCNGTQGLIWREQTEQKIFCLPNKVLPEDRPQSGMLIPKNVDYDYIENGPANQYGRGYGDHTEAIVIMKKDLVNDATTFTCGDSLMGGMNTISPTAVSTVANPTFQGAAVIDFVDNITNAYPTLDELKNGNLNDIFGDIYYLELQFHGHEAKSAKNIESVIFRVSPDAALQLALDKAGIPWTVLKGGV